MASTAALFDELRGFLTEKAAGSKRAESNTEAGGYQGGTTHPVGSAPDNTKPAPEGARSSENEADIKKTIPASVNSAPDQTTPQSQAQLSIGVTQSATGEDASVEKGFKGEKDDPGTTHPAKTDDGKKYAAAKYAGKSFSELYKAAGDLANQVMADISVKAMPKQAQNPPGAVAAAAAPAAAPATPAGSPQIAEAQRLKMAEAGYQLAATLANEPSPDQTKVAADEAYRLALSDTLRNAHLAADLGAGFILSYQQEKMAAVKRAADENDATEGESHEKPEPKVPEGLAAEGGGPLPPPAPPGGGMGGGGSSGPGGGAPPEEAINQLITALLEMGVTPDQLMQALQGGGSGGAGGMPPGGAGGGLGGVLPPPPPPGAGMPPPGAGMPPPGAGGAPPGMEVAASSRKALWKLAEAAKHRLDTQRKDGTFRLQEPKTAKDRQLVTEMQKFIADLVR